MCTRALLETVGMLSAAWMTILLLLLKTVHWLKDTNWSEINFISKQLNALVVYYMIWLPFLNINHLLLMFEPMHNTDI